MIEHILETIHLERIDDLPLLLAQLRRMRVIPLLDQHFPTHGNWAGELTFGEVAAVWLAAIVSTGDHRLNRLEDWAATRLELLAACLGKRVRALDFHDDRLADVLDALQDPTAWAAFELDLNAGLVRTYELPTRTVRVDTTTASTYARWDDAGGLFQFGHSKDHRPDLAQIKVPVAALDPLGMPLVTAVVAGNAADDPLYVPVIAQVQQSLDGSGRPFVGDCKMAAVETRGYLARTADFYLCPLSAVQVPAAELQRLLQPVWQGKQALTMVHRPAEDEADGPEEVARGFQSTVTQTATAAGHEVSWTERRLVVCSTAQARRQAAALDQRVERAVAELERLNERKQGKRRLTARAARAKAEQVVARHAVATLVEVAVKTTRTPVSRRKYRDRPAGVVVVLREARVVVRVDREAVATAKRQCGWRVYATNHPELTLPQAVLSYRGQYGIEHGFARLKGKALGLSPMYVQTDRRAVGLVHLLSIGLRALTLVEYVVRRSLAACGEKLRGVYAGQRGRGTSRPSAELLLEAFRGLDLRVVEAAGVRYRTVSPLSAVQRRILQLLEVPSHVYEGLAGSFSGSG
jgi:transposase